MRCCSGRGDLQLPFRGVVQPRPEVRQDLIAGPAARAHNVDPAEAPLVLRVGPRQLAPGWHAGDFRCPALLPADHALDTLPAVAAFAGSPMRG